MRGFSRPWRAWNRDWRVPELAIDVVALDDALESLLQLEPRLAQVIELHYFGGMTYDEIAAAVGAFRGPRVHRDIRLAKAWLLSEIGGHCIVISARTFGSKFSPCSSNWWTWKGGRARCAFG